MFSAETLRRKKCIVRGDNNQSEEHSSLASRSFRCQSQREEKTGDEKMSAQPGRQEGVKEDRGSRYTKIDDGTPKIAT